MTLKTCLRGGLAALALTTTALLTVGCTADAPVRPALTDADLVGQSYASADQLLQTGLLKLGQPVLVASFVNVDDVKRSSSLGRLVAEQFGSRFSQKGYTVVEMKLANSVYMSSEQGELLLSREVGEISRKFQAQAVLVGTYAVGKEHVFVTAKLVRAADSVILASTDYKLPMGPDTKRLVFGEM